MRADYNQRNKREILDEFAEVQTQNNFDCEKYRAIIMVKCVEDLEKSADTIAYSVDNFRKSIEDIGKKSDKLSGKLLWLNIVLTVATVIGAIATAILAFKK